MRGPSPTQVTTIREWSQRIFGDTDHVFDHYGKPADRTTASRLILALEQTTSRQNDEALREVFKEGTMEETRVCAECDVEKPIEEFRKFGRGRMKKCLDCDRFGKDDKPNGGRAEKAETPPKVERRTVTLAEYDPTLPVCDDAGNVVKEPVEAIEGHWCLAELRDPRLSVVETVRTMLNETFGVMLAEEFEGFTLEHAAELCGEIADLDLA